MKIEIKTLDLVDPYQFAYHANNQNVSRYLNQFPFPYTVDHANSFIQYSLKHHQLDYGIVIDNECVGCIGATFHKGIYQKNCEIGYWLSEAYWNLGIMSRIIPSFCDYIFQNFDIIKIHATVFHDNHASRHLLEKCGFKEEGYLKKHLFQNNQFYDAILYAKLKEEFQ